MRWDLPRLRACAVTGAVLALVAAPASAAGGATARCAPDDSTPPTGSPPADGAFVDTGAQTIRLCRYFGFNDDSGRRARELAHSALVTDGADVDRLTGELNALQRVDPSAAFACPSDDGTQFWLLFAYPDGRIEAITAQAYGCRFFSNERETRYSDPALLDEISRRTSGACPARTGGFARGRWARVSYRSRMSCAAAYRVIHSYDRRFPTHSRRPRETDVAGFHISFDPIRHVASAYGPHGTAFAWNEYGRA